MKKTLPDIQKSLDKLLLKHPEVEAYTIKNAAQFPHDHHTQDCQWLSDFIDRAWSHTYQRRDGAKNPRFVYSPGYLEWLLAPPWADKNLMYFVVDKKGRVAALAFALNKMLAIGNSKLKTVLNFCKSVDPDHTGKGIGQLLHFHEQKNLFEKGEPYDASLGWYDNLGSRKGGSMNTSKRVDPFLNLFEYPMLIRIIDYQRTIENTSLPPVQKFFARLTGGIPGKRHLPPHFSVRPFEKRDIDQVKSLLSMDGSPADDNTGRYIHNEDEIMRMLDFRPLYKDPFTTITTVMLENGQVVGLLHGYRIPVQDRRQDNVFFIDGIWMNSRISGERRHAFIVESLNIAWKEYNVYAAIAARGTFPEENLGKRIFLPVMDPHLRVRRRKLYMAITVLNEHVDLQLKHVKRMHIDHK